MYFRPQRRHLISQPVGKYHGTPRRCWGAGGTLPHSYFEVGDLPLLNYDAKEMGLLRPEGITNWTQVSDRGRGYPAER